jgi:hypothetical protein
MAHPQWDERALLAGGYGGADLHPGLAAFGFIGCSARGGLRGASSHCGAEPMT